MKYRVIATVLFCVFSAGAQATSLTWTLDNWVFDDGGIATGSFEYDADLDLFSNVNVTTSGGTKGTTTQYGYGLNVQFSPGDGLDFVPMAGDQSGSPVLSVIFEFPSVLSNGGGVVDVDVASFLSGELQCLDAGCTLLDATNERLLISGSVSAVPLPAAAWFFISALGGLVGVRRLKAKRA